MFDPDSIFVSKGSLFWFSNSCLLFPDRDESLKSHVKFLETLDIAGVSHHSLLFSKTEPVEAEQVVEEINRSSLLLYINLSPLLLCISFLFLKPA